MSTISPVSFRNNWALPALSDYTSGVTLMYSDLSRRIARTHLLFELLGVKPGEELVNGHSPTGHLRGGKYSAFEGGTRIPLIVHWPAKINNGGASSDVLISQIDWLASMAALTCITIPSGQATDSFNRLGNLLGTDSTDRPWIVEQASNKTLSLCTKDWKLSV